MDFFVALRLIVRRWYVVVSALVVTVVVAYTVMQSVAPSYRAEGSVLLYAPSGDEEDEGAANPFRSFDSSTSVLAAVMVQVMNDPLVRNEVGLGGGRPDYEVGLNNDGTPVIVLRATDTDEGVAIETVRLATDALQGELERRQTDAGAPEEVRIRAIVLTEANDADLLVGDRIRAFIVVLAIGVAASISMAFLAESIAQSGRRKATVAGDADRGIDVVGDGDADERADGDAGPADPATVGEVGDMDHFDELVRLREETDEPVPVGRESGSAEP